eukprot:TRINITY_DN4641_c1_g1_i1.p1 TRINITY_DN4641_c1_g1~~TRINITY_DN4641_c1_g1_i1.p1  ORF type:complete len:374 (+),score=71.37 TRINITY_DN4641_c1_g1_i1:225-1346(+)
MSQDFAALLSRTQSNDPSLVALIINWSTPGLPYNRAELVASVVAALARNAHVQQLTIEALDLCDGDVVPLAELLTTRDLDSLDLSNNKLTGRNFLPALVQRKSLRVLSLRGNKDLGALDQLIALTALKELDLRCCGLSAAPPIFSTLEALKLNENHLKTLPASFAALGSLRSIHLSYCRLTEFPTVLLSSTLLEVLEISYNHIRCIPEGISALVNLRRFSAQHCGLTGFPTAISQLVHLEAVDLSDNSIQCVPDEIGSLHGLTELKLVNCGLSGLPGAFWALAHLEKLDLSRNPLTSLPSMKKLRELDLQSCGFTQLPRGLQSLTALQSLNVKNTVLTHLPVWLASLSSLRTLQYESGSQICGVALHDNTLRN